MSGATWHTGDTRDVLRTLPDASVDLVMTSPPFLALRSYLPADHPDKGKEIGSESNPGAFLDVLLDVVVELRRVLAPHGSLCVELGDTYSGSTADGGDNRGNERYPNGRSHVKGMRATGTGWPLAKSLCLIPSTFAFALAYGRNPWTGREIEPWRVRNLIAWARPNPPVGALGDKFRPATSYMTVACVGGSRYFDLDAVREAHQEPRELERRNVPTPSRAAGPRTDATDGGDTRGFQLHKGNPAGAPPLDYWVIPTHPYPGSHYATYPPELCVRPVKAMCPQRVCRVCGKPSERIAVTNNAVGHAVQRAAHRNDPLGSGDGRVGVRSIDDAPKYSERETLGWTDCGHDDWRSGVVLDPFAGSGTTLSVATGHGRDAIGIDLDPRNYDLARERIGMFLVAAETVAP